MIVKVLNIFDVLRYRLKFGKWCDHLYTKERLINTGTAKMKWCIACGKSKFF